MSAVSRLSDMVYGVCTIPFGDSGPHADTGQIVEGAGQVNAEGLPVARVSDLCLSDSHGAQGQIVEGAGQVNAEGLPVARIGDRVEGAFYGTIIEGAGQVFAGG